MATHFLADLHLTDTREPNAQRLARYLAGPALEAEAVYVLGDLFDVWIGDDGSLPTHRETVDRLGELAARGVPIYFMRGNRDFAVGEAFVQASGMRILEDPCVVDLYGIPTLLSHGDYFCTDDAAHQAFRAKYMNPVWRRRMLRLPLLLRRLLAKRARRKSTEGKALKPWRIMDVNPDAVAATMRENGVQRLIHGHTHRPETHVFDLDGARAERHVLPNWRPDQAGVLVVDESELRTVWLHDELASRRA